MLQALALPVNAALLTLKHAWAPKAAKGTRDFSPQQLMIRKHAFEMITAVFERHGAVSIDTPVFELRETLMGKYGEDSKLIYDLADQGGEILSLRYDLTVPFARYVAEHALDNIKRFHVGKVYRRDQPQMTRGRFREFYQCDLDIAGRYAPMVPDAEILAVVLEILTELQIGTFVVKVSHRRLLDAMMAHSGVPQSKFRTICSAIDKLDKTPWPEVRSEMVDEKRLDGDVADRIGRYVRDDMGSPAGPTALLSVQILDRLRNDSLSQVPAAQEALGELERLIGFLDSMGALDSGLIELNLSLARGLDYYTGLIYEAVMVKAFDGSDPKVGSIAAGGRYDNLVGMFSGKQVPAVGISIGIERIFALLEQKWRSQGDIRERETQVLVASVGEGMLEKRMQVCAQLWRLGVAAEFGYKEAPKFPQQLREANDHAIPLMVLFGRDELQRGVAKVRSAAVGCVA
eukprot:jgi/Astpho2/8088/fgenesh1_pm.00120_%23_11_t